MKRFFTILFYLIFVDDGPTAMISNYFDYSISTPTGVSVCNQPTEVGGGTYYAFHSRETAAYTC